MSLAMPTTSVAPGRESTPHFHATVADSNTRRATSKGFEERVGTPVELGFKLEIALQ